MAAVIVAACDASEPHAPSAAPATVVAAEESRSSSSPATLDDAMVAAKVKAALIAETGGKALSIDVASQQNVVTLSGTVGSEAIRNDAERVARSIKGVKHIRNNLTVKQPS